MIGYPPQKGSPEIAKLVKEISHLKYGRPRETVETEILERTRLVQSEPRALNRGVPPTF